MFCLLLLLLWWGVLFFFGCLSTGIKSAVGTPTYQLAPTIKKCALKESLRYIFRVTGFGLITSLEVSAYYLVIRNYAGKYFGRVGIHVTLVGYSDWLCLVFFCLLGLL